MAEGARLESVFRGNSNVGSNPTLSAIAICPFHNLTRQLFISGIHHPRSDHPHCRQPIEPSNVHSCTHGTLGQNKLTSVRIDM